MQKSTFNKQKEMTLNLYKNINESQYGMFAKHKPNCKLCGSGKTKFYYKSKELYFNHWQNLKFYCEDCQEKRNKFVSTNVFVVIGSISKSKLLEIKNQIEYKYRKYNIPIYSKEFLLQNHKTLYQQVRVFYKLPKPIDEYYICAKLSFLLASAELRKKYMKDKALQKKENLKQADYNEQLLIN